MSRTALEKLTGRHPDRKELAAREARRRWEEVRSHLERTADTLGDAAEEQWEHARTAAAPTVKQLRKRATEVLDTDVERVRDELSTVAGDVRRNLAKASVDLRDATRAEADRIISAINESAMEAREAERKRRVRALVGWTLFGMAAGAVLALNFGPKGAEDEREEGERVHGEPTADAEGDEAGAADAQPSS